MKFGTQGAYQMHNDYGFNGTNQLAYRFNSRCDLLPGATAPCNSENGLVTPVPNQFTMRLGPRTTMNRTVFHAFYAQDQWTMKRAHGAGRAALRVGQELGARGQRHRCRLAVQRRRRSSSTAPRACSGYHDISPRVGVAYDVFGTGKTALKVNIGHYLSSANNEGNFTINNPVSQLQTSTNRSWTDANGNFTPDCELMNPAQQDLRAERRRFLRRLEQPGLRRSDEPDAR